MTSPTIGFIRESCSSNYDDNILFRTICLLTYDGNIFHFALNYSLLILNLIFWYHSIAKTIKMSQKQERRRRRRRQRRRNNNNNNTESDDDDDCDCDEEEESANLQRQIIIDNQMEEYDDYEKIPLLTKCYYLVATIMLLVMILFQILFNLHLKDCIGISFIWCFLDGWIVRDLIRRNRQEENTELKFIAFFLGVSILDGVIILYYFFVDGPIITTFRIIMHSIGSALSQVSLFIFSRYSSSCCCCSSREGITYYYDNKIIDSAEMDDTASVCSNSSTDNANNTTTITGVGNKENTFVQKSSSKSNSIATLKRKEKGGDDDNMKDTDIMVTTNIRLSSSIITPSKSIDLTANLLEMRNDDDFHNDKKLAVDDFNC